MGLSAKYQLLVFLAFLTFGISMGQEGDLSLKESNTYVYEGNELVTDDFVSAEKEYRKAISKVPSNAIGSYNLGHAYFESGHFDESLLRHAEAAKNANSKEERHAAFHNIGNILMEQKLCKEAVEAYKNALRNNPSDDESRYNLALAQECAKEQGGGDGQDEDSDEKNEDENKESENNNSEDQKDQGENNEENEGDGDDQQDQNEGDENEDDKGKPSDESDDKQQDQPGNKNKKPQQQPGKLSPQQVRNLLEAMNNQEKKVQEKINARKTKGVKVRTEKDW
ncbi:MAG: tetratricopeptide repeat protein [Bacteroidia bacterium]|nr:tetratricopeptide repeat protein [Bacteroidia bacterium]